jgi:hypothetical protein
VSGPLGVGGFEEGEFEGDSPTEEVAAQACAGPTRSNSVRRKSTKPRKSGLSCSVIHSAWTKLSGSGCRAREAPIEIEPLGHNEDRKRASIAARFRRLAHDRLEAGGRLRIGIGGAPCLRDAKFAPLEPATPWFGPTY